MDFMVPRNRNTHTMATTKDTYLERFWPAMRARNFVKHLSLHSGRPLTREQNLALLAIYAKISLAEIKVMSPISFSYKVGLYRQQVIRLMGRQNAAEAERELHYIQYRAKMML